MLPGAGGSKRIGDGTEPWSMVEHDELVEVAVEAVGGRLDLVAGGAMDEADLVERDPRVDIRYSPVANAAAQSSAARGDGSGRRSSANHARRMPLGDSPGHVSDSDRSVVVMAARRPS